MYYLHSLQRYYGAHVILHALQYYIQDEDERRSLQEYKDAVERRFHLLHYHPHHHPAAAAVMTYGAAAAAESPSGFIQ